MMQLEISPEECHELVTLVEKSLAETRVEVRRTRNPEWQEALHQEERTLQDLLAKLEAVAV